MTIRAYPTDDPLDPTTELEWRRMMRWLMEPGVIAGQLNELVVSERGAGANMSVDVASGHSFHVGHMLISDAVESVAIANNATGDDRVDLVVAGWDFAANVGDIYVIQGAAGGPVAPAPTQDITTEWEIPLAEVLVAAGESTSILDGDITDLRVLVTSPPFAGTAPNDGDTWAYNATTGLWEPGSSGTDPAMVLIGEVTLSTDAFITFSSIPATYRHLLLVVHGRSSHTTTTDLVIRINDDVAGNYDWQRMGAAGTSVTAAANNAQTFGKIGGMPGSDADAGAPGSAQVLFPDYARTTFWKSYIGQAVHRAGAGSGAELSQEVGLWKSTAAINQIAIFTTSAALLAGSTASLYGLENA